MNIALIGAGGKMGSRITDNFLKSNLKNSVSYVEVGEAGIAKLAAKGIKPMAAELAVPQAEFVILALPDRAIGKLAPPLLKLMKKNAMVILLDPAAVYLDQVPARPDTSVFVTHPCHPPVFNDEIDPEAKRDFFGGVKAKQSIVCALKSGPESDYTKGEEMAKVMYGPIIRSHRITVDQMAILEPAMAETVGSMLSTVLGEALKQAVKAGVPEAAAKDFMLGHIQVQLGIVFGDAGFSFSDACQVAIEYGRKYMIRDGWQELFDHKSVREQVDVMLNPEKLPLALKAMKH